MWQRVLVDITPTAQALLDNMLSEVQQMSAMIMATLTDAQKKQWLVSLAAVRQALTELPQDVPPPEPRQTPSSCAARR